MQSHVDIVTENDIWRTSKKHMIESILISAISERDVKQTCGDDSARMNLPGER